MTSSAGDLKKLAGYMRFGCVVDHQVDASGPELIRAAADSQIHTFGWPIGVVIETRTEFRPRRTPDGVKALIETDEQYDFWELKRNGEYFIYKSLFEDRRSKTPVIYFDTRIVRTAELLLRTARLYDQLGVPNTAAMSARIEWGGLKGRKISVANPNRILMPFDYTCDEERVSRDVTTTLERLQDPTGLKSIVYEVVSDLFEYFAFFRIDKAAVADPIVDAFLQGRIV